MARKSSYDRICGPQGHLARREPFEGNSMSAEIVGSRWLSTGCLRSPDRELFAEANQAGLISYVVYSYLTPIAWLYNDGQVYITRQQFSITTSKQQGYVHWLAHDDRSNLMPSLPVPPRSRRRRARPPTDILDRIDRVINDWSGSADSMRWTPGSTSQREIRF